MYVVYVGSNAFFAEKLVVMLVVVFIVVVCFAVLQVSQNEEERSEMYSNDYALCKFPHAPMYVCMNYTLYYIGLYIV